MAVRDDFTAGEVLAAADLNDTFASKLDLAGGKVLQIVRATDSTIRTTTSTSFVDTGISVTITPQKSDSAIIVIAVFVQSMAVASTVRTQITDNSNNALSGAEDGLLLLASVWERVVQIGYATPSTTSAVSYKLRHRGTGSGAESNIRNDIATGQMYAIEVSA